TKARANCSAVVVLGARSAVAALPLVTAALAALGPSLDSAPEDHGVQLLAHFAGLSLMLNLVAVDHAPTIRIGTGGVTVRHRAGRVLVDRVHDLEAAMTVGAARPIAQLWGQPHSGTVRCQPPIRRERDQPVAIRAADGASPQKVCRYGGWIGFA